ncbi:uncharacterized protein [Diadema antillarum]|uniref:uncharacterized protein n=1 Tax=Diadema antillarum TaxID=105358 RepID=UPI003A886647
MAYVYSNALNVSIAMLVLGLIQITFAVSCEFGCYADKAATYAAPGWSGLMAVLTGIFGICMVRHYKEVVMGVFFFVLSVVAMLASMASLAIIGGIAWMAEYDLAVSESDDREKTLNATGLAIHTCTLVFGLCLLITSCYATWLNCCCEKAPTKKGYGLALEPVRVAHGDSPSRQRGHLYNA